MHWIDRIARALLERGREHVIACGTSISGHIHIGHCNDIFIADGIRRAIEELGGRAEAIWYADDYDPMRRVPWPLNDGPLLEEYERYLGMPYIDIPSPDPSYENFVDFFTRPFTESLAEFGVKLRVYSGAEVYRGGEMADIIRTALERADEIREILNRYRSEPLPEGWLPYDPICESCGRIATTQAYAWEDDLVRYRCVGCDYATGCGHEGEVDYTKGEGKLTWRVEWPARWKLLGVTCEPFGKDHAAAGGSYGTGRLIAERIFGSQAPYPVPYEWIDLKSFDESGRVVRKRMSSSAGVVFTLPQWLKVAEPELLRYFIFRSKPTKAKEFDPRALPELYDEYDLAERIYFGKAPSGRRGGQLRRIYELSQPSGVPEKVPQRVPFRLAIVLSQVMRDERHAEDILVSKGILIDPARRDIQLAIRRLKLARGWVEEYTPPHLRFKLAEVVPEAAKGLLAGQKAGLKRLAEDLASRDYKPVELHNRVYELAAEVGITPPELFEAIYLALLGRLSGPRAGNLIWALDKGFVIERFEEVAS